MSEFSGSENDYDAFTRHDMVKIGQEIMRKNHFMGCKVARELMSEQNMSLGDETGDAALEEMMGTCISAGITHGMQGADEHTVHESIQQLSSHVPPLLIGSLGVLIPYLVSHGIQFYTTEIAQQSPKAQAWSQEYYSHELREDLE